MTSYWSHMTWHMMSYVMSYDYKSHHIWCWRWASQCHMSCHMITKHIMYDVRGYRMSCHMTSIWHHVDMITYGSDDYTWKAATFTRSKRAFRHPPPQHHTILISTPPVYLPDTKGDYPPPLLIPAQGKLTIAEKTLGRNESLSQSLKQELLFLWPDQWLLSFFDD